MAKAQRSKTPAESAHLGKVAALPCALCVLTSSVQDGATYVHHILEGTGISQRASHFLTVPLCYYHHQGDGGIHGLGRRMFNTRYRMEELDLLAWTIFKLTSTT